MSSTQDFWRRCSSCKEPIHFLQDYYVCSVSSCNRKRDGMVFCSHACFDRHSPVMGHRDPWAEPRTAPSPQESRAPVVRRRRADPKRDRPMLGSSTERPGADARFRARSSMGVAQAIEASAELPLNDQDIPEDVLVVVSKLKAYILARSGMKTSATCNEALSDIVRAACDKAMQEAHRDERKTVMGRDFIDG